MLWAVHGDGGGMNGSVLFWMILVCGLYSSGPRNHHACKHGSSGALLNTAGIYVVPPSVLGVTGCTP